MTNDATSPGSPESRVNGTSQSASLRGGSLPPGFKEGKRPGGAGQTPSKTITPRLVLYTVSKWWMLALPAGLVCAALAAGIVLARFKPQYRASAWIQIFERPQYLVFGDSDRQDFGRAFVATQLQLIMSPMVMLGTDNVGPEGVVDALLQGRLEGWAGSDVPDLTAEKEQDRWRLTQWVTTQVSVQRVGNDSELYTISFDSRSPEFAQAIANAITQSYLTLVEDRTKERSRQLIDLLEESNEARTKDLVAERRALTELAKELPNSGGLLGSLDVGPYTTSALAELQSKLTAAEVDMELIQAQVRWLENPPEAADSSAGSVPSDVPADPKISASRERIVASKALLEHLKTVARQGEEDPRCKELRDEIRRMEEQLQKDIQARTAAYRQAALAAARSELAKRQLAVNLLGQRYQALLTKAQQGNRDSLELELKRAEVARKQVVIEAIASRIQTQRTEQAAPEQVTLWKLADLPTQPVEEYPFRVLTLAASAAFCFPIVLFVLWEFLAGRVYDTERLEQDLNVVILGEIARLPSRRFKAVNRSGKFDRSVELFRESFDTLSTNLSLSQELREVRVLAVASAVSSEGKTSVAAELAQHVSENAAVDVLLIDGDLRSPDLHRFFKIPLEPGLAGILTEKCTLDEAIVPTSNRRLDVLPAGRLTSSPLPLLSDGKWRALLGHVPLRYRYVIIDTPPVLAASEAMIYSNAADATLLCVMCEASREGQVLRAHRRLVMSGASNLRVVISGVRPQPYLRRYGDYVEAS